MESKPALQSEVRRPLLSILGASAGILGPVIFWIISLVVASFEPDYNPLRDTISALVLAPRGWLQNVSFILFGLLLITFASGLYDSIRKRGWLKTGLTLLALTGMGMIIIAIFPTDNGAQPHTLNGLVHQYTTRTMGAIFPFSCILMIPSLRTDVRWRRFVTYTLATGIAAFCLDFVWLLGTFFDWINQWAGLVERGIVFNSFVWIEVMSFRLLFLILYQRRRTPNGIKAEEKRNPVSN